MTTTVSYMSLNSITNTTNSTTTRPTIINNISTNRKTPITRNFENNYNTNTGSNNDNTNDNQLANAIEKLAFASSLITPIINYNMGADPKIWIKKYDKACLLNGWGDSLKVKYFPKYVPEEVLTWISENFFSLESLNWETLKSEFLKEFKSKENCFTNRIKLNNLKQESNESVRIFFTRGLELIESVNESMTTQEKIEILAFGLKPEIRDKIMQVSFWPFSGGIREFKDIALSAENIINMNKLLIKPQINNTQTNTNKSHNYNKSNNYKSNSQYSNQYRSNNYFKNGNYPKNYPNNYLNQNKGYSSNNSNDYNTSGQYRQKYCYTCGDPNHLSNICPSKQRDQKISRAIESTNPNNSYSKNQYYNQNREYNQGKKFYYNSSYNRPQNKRQNNTSQQQNNSNTSRNTNTNKNSDKQYKMLKAPSTSRNTNNPNQTIPKTIDTSSQNRAPPLPSRPPNSSATHEGDDNLIDLNVRAG